MARPTKQHGAWANLNDRLRPTQVIPWAAGKCRVLTKAAVVEREKLWRCVAHFWGADSPESDLKVDKRTYGLRLERVSEVKSGCMLES